MTLPAPGAVPPILSVFGGADFDAIIAVSDSGGAAGIQSDQVALDCVAIGVQRVLSHKIAAERNAGKGVAGDDVAGTRRGPANQVVGAVYDENPEESAGVQGEGAGRVGTDVIPLDGLVGGAEEVQVRVAAGADDVAGRGSGAADRIVTGVLELDAVITCCPARRTRSRRCRSGCPRSDCRRQY